MRKLFTVALLMVLCVSCKSLPERFNEFVSEVEINCETYSDVDWKVIEQKHAQFEAEYVEQYDNLSSVQKDLMKKNFGRYDAIVAKSAISGAFKDVKRMFEGAGEYIEGLIDGLMKDTVDVK